VGVLKRVAIGFDLAEEIKKGDHPINNGFSPLVSGRLHRGFAGKLSQVPQMRLRWPKAW